MKTYSVVGMMSGTSLDGVDLAHCRFTHSEQGEWSYELGECLTIPYPQKWTDILRNIQDVEEMDLYEVDRELGTYFGRLAENFIERFALEVDFVASHGHTAYHRPELGVTRQIGDGEAMVEILRIPVINDFRSKDVRLGGQGAPLVPIGDALLFSDYDICVNLGGFANLSYTDDKSQRVAFDICPMNMALDQVAMRLGKTFDKGGQLAAKGVARKRVLRMLDGLEYYGMEGPRSLGREWFREVFEPCYAPLTIPAHDLLATLTEHAARQVAKAIDRCPGHKVLFTGGGVLNEHLMSRIRFHCSKDIHIPTDSIIHFKEALVFGFLGVLRWRNEVNIWSSVTGAEKDHCSGVIHRL